MPQARRAHRGFRSLLASSPFRRLLPALVVSDLGDGMSLVAVAWLAVQIGAPGAAGPLVAAAVSAYVLPGAAGAMLLGRWLRRRPPHRLLQANAWTRAVFLCCVPLAWAAGALHPVLYVALLAGSSILHAWGHAARYALVARLLPANQRLAANSLVSTSMWVSRIAGPALAGVLTTVIAPAWVIGLDAVSFAVLAVQAGRVRPPENRAPATPAAEGRPASVLAVLRARRDLLVLLVVAALFNLAYGPVEVALPLFVSDTLHADADLLGLYWAAFGAGAVAGALAAGLVRGLSLWPVLLGIIAGHGVAMLPFGLPAPAAVSLVGFGLAGVIYGPYNALSFHLFQNVTPDEHLTAVLAFRAALLLTATPLGAALAGPLATVLGARQILAGTGLGMIVIAAAAAGYGRVARSAMPDPGGGLFQTRAARVRRARGVPGGTVPEQLANDRD
jgi:predicted MFS family arabinose efflux permease